MKAGLAASASLVAGLLFSLCCESAAAPIERDTSPLLEKADAWVVRKLAREGTAEILVVLRDKADLSSARALRGKEARGRFVVEQLRGTADRAQAPLLAWLAARGIEHRPFWVANMIWVQANSEIAIALAARSEVARLAANPVVRLSIPQPTPPPEASAAVAEKAVSAVEWGVAKIRAPEVWAAGFTGQGIVLAGADTGYDWNHPALRDKYRGWNGTSADHNYNWHDAVHAFGSICGGNTTQPCDDGFHGTHTMGTMVGDDGAGNQTGVAPGARWIGCRNMDQGFGTPASYTECFQWFLAPTNLAGASPDPGKAPDIISNSWLCPAQEGCTDPEVLRTVVENVRAAGIVVVFSAGNEGNGGICATVALPPAIYDAAFSVGATDSLDRIAGFSSRGPVTADGSSRLKPDISAPGVDIRSSIPGGGYTTLQGTSMAAPHVAGAAALLLSALPALTGQPEALEARLKGAAVPRTTTETCGGIPGSNLPNNTFGWGRLDAKAAFDGAPLAVLDLDLSIMATRYDALTDGLLVLRYLFGLTGLPLTAGALGATATRGDPDAIKAYLDSVRTSLDIDANGTTDALTDGLLILRYLSGARGAALTGGALGSMATRTVAAAIEAYLSGLTP